MISSRNMKHLMEVKEKLGNKYGTLFSIGVKKIINRECFIT